MMANKSFTSFATSQYIFYTKAPQTIQVKCESGTRHIVVHQKEIIAKKTIVK
jgi:hypothetical protein